MHGWTVNIRTCYEKTRAARLPNSSKLARRQKKPGTTSVDMVNHYYQAPAEGELTGLDNP